MSTQATIETNLATLGFDNPSNSAIFQLIAQALGQTVDNTLTEFVNSQNNILNIINTQRYGKSGYYTAAALAFQYGYNLTQDEFGNPIYAVIDPTALIVNQAAFEELDSGNSSQLFIKIATLNTLTGLLQPLSPPQLAAFTNYFVNFEIPGLPVSIINTAANILSFNANCTYFATYDFSILQTNMQAALLAFQSSFAFNGEFFAGDLSDYIKKNVPGVRDFFIYNMSLDGTPFAGSSTLNSGYFNYSTGITANPSTNINYTAIASL